MRRYRVVNEPRRHRRLCWVVQGESLYDPDGWVDIRDFAKPEEARAYVAEVQRRQLEQWEATK